VGERCVKEVPFIVGPAEHREESEKRLIAMEKKVGRTYQLRRAEITVSQTLSSVREYPNPFELPDGRVFVTTMPASTRTPMQSQFLRVTITLEVTFA